jgi:hypothetical protein
MFNKKIGEEYLKLEKRSNRYNKYTCIFNTVFERAVTKYLFSSGIYKEIFKNNEFNIKYILLNINGRKYRFEIKGKMNVEIKIYPENYSKLVKEVYL